MALKKHRIVIEVESDARVTQEVVREMIMARLPKRSMVTADGWIVNWASAILRRSRVRTRRRDGKVSHLALRVVG